MRASVKTNLSFSLATPADNPAIRRLLRDNPMPGTVSLSLEREPNYFADANQPGETKQTIIAKDSDRVVCVGYCTTRLRFVNGQPCRVGYLGGLRLDTSVAARFDILRRGYQFFRELQTAAPADFYFTSIATDNHRARNFLERNLRGMPRYEFLGEFVTLLIATPHASSPKAAQRTEQPVDFPQLARFLNEFNQNYQLAPHWTSEQLESLASLGLRAEDFVTSPDQTTIAAIWDQRAFKQTVIRGYAPWLTLLRPTINLIAGLTRTPALPAVGDALSHAYVSHCTATDLSLLNGIRVVAAKRRIQWLTVGLAATDPRLPTIRSNFHCREYHSRLYCVHWPGLGSRAADLDNRILAPEVALL